MFTSLTKRLFSLAAPALFAGTALPAAAQDTSYVFSLSDQMRVTYYWLYLPEILGYWAEEGVSVDVQSVGGSLEALQQVVAGNADFGQMGAANVIQAAAQQQILIQVAMLNGVFQWKLGVPADSGVTSIEDLRGESVGVFSASTNGNVFLQAYLEREGLEIDTDVTFLPVGSGPSALEALRRGEVAALYFWPSAFVSYEAQGLEFNYFSAEEWSGYPDFSVAALESTLSENPEAVEGFVRAMTKATIFAEANPECTVRLFWDAHPDAKPTGVDEEQALATDLAMLHAQLEEADIAAAGMGSANFGAITAQSMESLKQFLLDAGLLEGDGTSGPLVIEVEGFFDRTNDFDHEAITAAAQACAF